MDGVKAHLARSELSELPASIRLILERRSISQLAEPGPTAEQLSAILEAGTTVPDHGTLRPYRFVVIAGESRALFGEALAAATKEASAEVTDAALAKARQKAFMAPTQIALIASPKAHPKIPAWEQAASAACAGYALVLAAHALGLGAVWKSTNFGEMPALRQLLALREGEKLLGWINVGTAAAALPGPRARLDLNEFVRFL